MYPSAKVLWGEGLFLRPQHFQMQDQYHEARLAEALRILHPYAFGVRSVKIDTQMLSAGLLSISEISLVWPDGDWYQAPDQDVLPTPLQIDTANMEEQVVVHLAIPILRQGNSNMNMPEKGQHGKFVQKSMQSVDLMSEATPAEIIVLQRQARLVLEGQSLDELVSLPIARLRRTAAGVYELDSQFVPPLVTIGASTTVMNTLQRLLNITQAKITALYGHHREGQQDIVEFRSGDIASFWLLHTASTGYAALVHLLQNPGLHPERLHQELARFAGSLMTFAKNHTLNDIPAYSHYAPMKGFIQIEQIVRDLLDTVISTRFLNISIAEKKPTYWIGKLESDRIDASARLYLSINSSMPAHEIVSLVPIRFKVGSPDDVEKRVLAALPAVPLTHITQVPPAIPIRPGASYFAVEPNSPLYEQMLQAQSICIYTSNGFSDLKIELMAVL